ncbi:MAG: hypothetical protein ACRETG_07845, partial [Steroidobacteraceae bacterium]
LVDDEFAPLADKIRASLKGLGADRPVRFVINTHYHSDINAGGSVQGMIRACEDVLKSVPARTKVVPGHGDLSDVDGLREYLRMLRDTTAVIARALKAGETLDHMKKARLLGAWSERYSPPKAFIDTDAFTETLYYSLKPRAGAAGAR